MAKSVKWHDAIGSCRWKGSSAASPKNGFADVGAARRLFRMPRKAPGSWIPKDIHKKPIAKFKHFPPLPWPTNRCLFDALIRVYQLPAATSTGLLSIYHWVYFFLGCLNPHDKHIAPILWLTSVWNLKKDRIVMDSLQTTNNCELCFLKLYFQISSHCQPPAALWFEDFMCA